MKVLGSLPFDPKLAAEVDAGRIEANDCRELDGIAEVLKSLAKK